VPVDESGQGETPERFFQLLLSWGKKGERSGRGGKPGEKRTKKKKKKEEKAIVNGGEGTQKPTNSSNTPVKTGKKRGVRRGSGHGTY